MDRLVTRAKKKICIVTGTRAEYGIYSPLLKKLKKHPAFQLQIVVTGAHLSPEFGSTYRKIEEDGFKIDEKVEMLLSSDTSVGVTKSLGVALSGFADAFERLSPDLMVLLGDRYEMFGAAQAALLARIPIAHISGGDVTEGAYDEAFRHGITKMSHIHFTTHAEASRRVKQLGENPRHVHTVGSLALDSIHALRPMKRSEVEKTLDFKFREKNILVTFHPATLASTPPEKECAEVLKALELLGPEVGILFTRANADSGGRVINQMMEKFAENRPQMRVYASLGHLLYFNTVNQVDVVVGNSSSGIYEAPALHKPTVNIGDRQKGRTQAKSVINCSTQAREIHRAILSAFKKDCSRTTNPYGKGDAANQMLKVLERIPDFSALIAKRFFDL